MMRMAGCMEGRSAAYGFEALVIPRHVVPVSCGFAKVPVVGSRHAHLFVVRALDG